MALLDEKDSEFLKKDFSKSLKNNVKLVFFKSENGCLYCKEIKDILEEVAGLSDKISMEEVDIDNDKEKAGKYNIKKAPAIAIEGNKDYGIRFYGIPAGHEFMTLVTSIKNVSTESPSISEKTKEKLQAITRPFNIQVFVTPT